MYLDFADFARLLYSLDRDMTRAKGAKLNVGWLDPRKAFDRLRSIRSVRRSGWAAIDIVPDEFIVGVRVSPPAMVSEKPRVSACRIVQGLAEVEGVAEVVGSVAAPDFGVTTTLAGDGYQLILGERPAVRAEEMAQSLQWALDSKLDYPASTAYLAWFNVPGHPSTQNRPRQQYVVAARQSAVNERISLIERAGCSVDAVDVRETARRNLGALIESQTGSAVLLLVPEKIGLQITVTFGGELYLERLIRERLLDSEGTDNRERQLDRISLELQRTLDFLRRNTPFIQIDELLFAPGSPAEIVEGLASRLNETLRVLDLSGYFTFDPGLGLESPTQQAKALTALGAALRYRESVVE